MKKEELKTWLEKTFLNSDQKLSPWCSRENFWVKNNYGSHLKYLKDYTNFLPNDSKIIERIICLFKNIEKKPLCNICKINPVKYFAKYKDFAKTCSIKCSAMDELTKQKRKKTNLKIFNTEYNFQNKDFKEQSKKTCLTKYGVSNPMQSLLVKQKQQKTCLTKYGVSNVFQNQEIKNKIKNTTRKNSLEKYGREHHLQNKLNEDVYNKLTNKEWLFNEHHTLKKPLSQIAKELDIWPSTLPLYLQKLNITQQYDWSHSQADKNIFDYVNSLGIEAKLCDREILQGKEIDILIPSFNLGIEHHGLYWHSYFKPETTEEKNQHLNKLIFCKSKKINLLQIFGNEWEDEVKRNIWKSIISTKLGKNTKIFARKCKIIEIDSKNANIFLNYNHLQGITKQTQINIGLFFKDELVSLMTFSKPRFNKNFDFELIRYASKCFTTVVGGAARLFKYFLKSYTESKIISYADLRYSTGKIYETLGFKKINQTKPNYWYWKKNTNLLESRIKYQKHKLSHLLGNRFISNLSESQNMFNNNFGRIWDCGNLVYSYHNPLLN